MAAVRPISFAIPEEKVVDSVPEKTQFISVIDPTHSVPGKRNYQFTEEAAYYAEYQKSIFAMTCKKAGWDCLRHYEIMANGCIPLFDKIDACPPSALSTFPKGLATEAWSLHNRLLGTTGGDMNKLSSKDHKDCLSLAQNFLDYTRNNLTTKTLALSILKDWELDTNARVLFVASDPRPDYQRDLLLHGFKSLLGKRCTDLHRLPYMYSDFSGDTSKLYGRGMTYSKTIDPSLHEPMTRPEAFENVRDAYYSLIIYGSCHRCMDGYMEVFNCMQGCNTMVVCGEDPDSMHTCDPYWFLARRNRFYRREPATKDAPRSAAMARFPNMININGLIEHTIRAAKMKNAKTT